MLTALGTVDDKLEGFEAGADDYLVKPFEFKELLARIKTLLKRSAKEFQLLEYMMRNKGRVLSRADIAGQVWDIGFDTGTNIIDVYINFLRKKIDKDFLTKLIHT